MTPLQRPSPRPLSRRTPAFGFLTAFALACFAWISSPPASAQQQPVRKPAATAHARPAPAPAQPAVPEEDTEVYVVAKVRAEIPQLTTEVAQASAEASAATAERQRDESTRDNTDHQARAFNDSPQSQQLLADKQNYDNTCAGKRLYGGQIAQCANAASDIQGRLNTHNAQMIDYSNTFQQQDAAAQQALSRETLAQAKLTKLRNYLSWLTAADSQVSSALTADCKNIAPSTSIEELKHRCGNIRFDGARTTLPPCTTEACQTWVIYAQSHRTAAQAIQEYKNGGAASPTKNPILDRGNVPRPPQ